MKGRKNHFGRAILCGILIFCLVVSLSSLVLKLQGKPGLFDLVPELVRTYLGTEEEDRLVLTALQTPQELAQKSIPHFEMRWMLQNLNDDDLRNFVALYRYAENAILKGEPSEWVLLPIPTTYEKAEQLVEILRVECPELVTLNTKGNLRWNYKDRNGLISVSLPSLSDGREMAARAKSVIDTLVQETSAMSEAEKELYVYEFLTNNTVYDLETNWAGTAYGALTEGRAKCDGMSLAFKWVMEEMGIPCLVVTGRPQEGEGHAWNLVRIENQWYAVDATMDMIHEDETEPHENSYYAFNTSEKWAARDLTVDDFGISLPEANTMNASWHVANGSFLRNLEEAKARLNTTLLPILRGDSDADTRILFQFRMEADMTIFLNDLEGMLRELLENGEYAQGISWRYSVSSMPEFKTVAVKVEKEDE